MRVRTALGLAVVAGGLALLTHDTSGARMWLGLSAVFVGFPLVRAPWDHPAARRPLAALTLTLVSAAALLTDWRGPGWHVDPGRVTLAFVTVLAGTALLFRMLHGRRGAGDSSRLRPRRSPQGSQG